MLSRRSVMLQAAAATLLTSPAARAAAILTEDGIYRQHWFLESLLDLPDDLKETADKRKRFAILWELRGCPYCKKLHEVNFADPQIEQFIKDRFEILQLNIIGSREVTDFDGETLPEKRFAQKYGIRYTPTLQFFPDSVAGLDKKSPQEREVARWQGYLEPKPFTAMFRFVSERGYEKGSLADFLKANT